jgi:hypothetical protein
MYVFNKKQTQGITDMIIDFESEMLKRSDCQDVCEDLLENLLYAVGASDDDLQKEDLLKKFIQALNLGPTPLTHLVRTYFRNADAQFTTDTILKEVPLSILSNLVELIETSWPQEKTLVKRFKVLLIGFGTKKLKLRGSFRNSSGGSWMIERIEDYLLDKDNALEAEILSPPSNVLKFPSFSLRES